MSVLLSVSGDGWRPFLLSVSIMKESMGLRTQRARSVFGSLVSWTGMNAQWPSHVAPCSIHDLMVLISALVSSFLNFGGGITSSGSSDVMRCHASLSSRLFRTKAANPSFSLKASSSKSNRNLAFRDFSEGPWQKKHLFERMGRMSLLKEISAITLGPVVTKATSKKDDR